MQSEYFYNSLVSNSQSFNDDEVEIPTIVHVTPQIHSWTYCAPKQAACNELGDRTKQKGRYFTVNKSTAFYPHSLMFLLSRKFTE